MKILLLTPPLTQLNTPYPATCQLTGFLRTKGIDAVQADLGIELVNDLFSKQNIEQIFAKSANISGLSKQHKIRIQHADFYIHTVDAVMRFLGGKNLSLAQRFSNLDFWPPSKRFPSDEDLEWAFGTIGNHDRAIHLCTLFIRDLVEFIQQVDDSRFELIRYAESLCLHLPDFDPIEKELAKPLTLVDERMLAILQKHIDNQQPEFIGFAIPFPGNLYGALRCASFIKQHYPAIKIIFGGGYVNTELRQLTDKQLFKYIDYLTFDDGELPLLRILKNETPVRTLFLDSNHQIDKSSMLSTENIPFSEIGTPTYDGLCNNNYINLIELTNPMHALWSNGRWNKMMLAHGCYWGKCTFCDGGLDYIGRYEKVPVELLVDRMEQIMLETGQTGFHFVDEAAPPAVLRQLAEEILRRKLVVSYWTNIRFEKSFNTELCYLLAQSGCIAVSGGLEVASPRILKLINKGITIESARETMKNLTEAGIMTHAYLMYGFPTQTARETVESLEVVRDLFANGWLQSAFWHRYAMTIHSPSGQCPESVGAQCPDRTYNSFANNELQFTTTPEIDLDYYGNALRIATYNYMQGSGYDLPVKNWFN